MNSTPAFSKVILINFKFAAVIFGCPSSDSARRIVVTPTLAAIARSSADHRSKALAARICAPVIPLIFFDFSLKTLRQCDMKTTITAETGVSTTCFRLTTIKLFGARIMDDSENSRTLSKIMQRYVLAICAEPHTDAALALWSEWFMLHEKREALSVKQQAMETRLLAMVDSTPIIDLAIPGGEASAFATTDHEIDALLPGEHMAEARRRAKAQLDKLRVEWQAADDQLGYSRAHQEELDVMHAELEAAKRLWMAPAQTIAGVTAKLHALVEWEDPGTTPGESPWPELRSILVDLIKIGDLNEASEATNMS
ncbi:MULTISPECIES: hypothetical protein [unclassified Rhizobium]|uniref:hypothetical protein n=1 Tax=unclassified Rhizobium TaxID=2613769 RepID=UPI0038184EA9